MPGVFDDLVPPTSASRQSPPAAASNASLFDDLVPKDQAAATQPAIPERSYTAALVLDPAKKFTSALIGMAGGIADIVSPDPIAPSESRLKNLAAGAGGTALSVLDWLSPPAANEKPGALRRFVTETETERAQARAREDALRVAQGQPTLGQQREQSAFNHLSDELAGFGQYLGTENVSEAQQAKDRALAGASEQGLLPALKYAAKNPLDFASSVGPQSAAYLVPAAAAGRTAATAGRAVGLSQEAAASLAGTVGITAVGATSTVQNASDVATQILNTDAAELAGRSELYRELTASGLSADQAKAEMATRAFTRTLTAAGLTNAATMGLAGRYRANVLEDWIAGRAPSVGSGIAGGAAGGLLKETVAEAAQEAGEAAATGIGEVGGGTRAKEKMFANVPGAAAIGAVAGGIPGAAIGAREGILKPIVLQQQSSSAPAAAVTPSIAEQTVETPLQTSAPLQANTRTDEASSMSADELRQATRDRINELNAQKSLSDGERAEQSFLREHLNDPQTLSELLGIELRHAEPALTDALELRSPMAVTKPSANVDPQDAALTAEQQAARKQLAMAPDVDATVTRRSAEDVAQSRGDDVAAEDEALARAAQPALVTDQSVQLQGQQPNGDVATAIQESLRGIANAPAVSVIRDAQSLSDHIKQKYPAIGEKEGAEGFYDPDTGEVYVFADVVKTPERARWVTFHELAGHHGLREAAKRSGLALDTVLDRARQNSTVEALARVIGQQRSITDSNHATDEAIAELAAAVRTGDYAHIEARYGLTVPAAQRKNVAAMIRRVIERIHAAVQRTFGKDTVSDTEIYDLIDRAWRSVATSPQSVRRSAAARAPAMSAASRLFDDLLPITPSTLHSSNAEHIEMEGNQVRSEHATVDDVRFSERAASGQLRYENKSASQSSPDADRLAQLLRVSKPEGSSGKSEPLLSEAPSETIRAAAKEGRVDGATSTSDESALSDERTAAVRARNAATIARAYARRNQALSRLAAAGYEQGAVGWNYSTNRWEGLQGLRTRAREKLQDKYLSLLEAQQDIEGATGEMLADVMDAYTLENLTHGKVADRMKKLETDILDPLQRLLKESGIKLALLEDYLLARHARERNTRIARVNPEMQDGGSGLTTQQAQDILAGKQAGPYSGQAITSEQRAILEKAATLIDRLRRQTLNALVESGSISKELAQQLAEAYRYYVPLRGKQGADDILTGIGGAGGRIDYSGPRVRRAAGRGAGNQPKNIVAEMVGDAQRALVGAELAPVRQGVLRMALKFPNREAWEVSPVEMERRLNKTTGEFYLAPKSDQVTRDDSLVIPLDGQTYRLQIHDPHLQTALLNLGREDLGAVMRALGAFNRFQSAVLTRYNPGFTLINLLRDAGFGVTRVASEYGAKTMGEVIAGYGPALRAIYSDVRGRQGDAARPDGEKNWLDWAREYTEAGSKTGIMRYDDVESIRKNLATGMRSLNDLWSEGVRGKAVATKEAVKRTVTPLAEAIEDINDATENAIRLGLYVSLRKQGKSTQQAAQAAKNLTVNFNRKGQWAGHLNAIFLFWNASVQGLHASTKVLSDPRVIGALTALGALQAVFATLLMGDDDEGDGVSTWDAVPAWRKRMSLVIPAPWAQDGYFALPMPYVFNLFPFLGGRIVQYARDQGRGDNNASSKMVTDTFGSIVQSVSPLPLDDGPMAILGHFPSILLRLATNRDDFGQPITRETYGKEVPAASLGRPDTSKVFHALSKGLNRIGGGSEDELPWIAPALTDVSPEQLEYLWKTATGGLGSTLAKGANVVEGVMNNRYDDLWEGLAAGPITGSFGFKGNRQRAVAERYYQQADRMQLMRDRFNVAAADVLKEVGTGDPALLERALEERLGEYSPYMDGAKVARYKTSSRKTDGKHYARGQVRTRSVGGREIPVLEWPDDTAANIYQRVNDTVKEESKRIREAQGGDLPTNERERVIKEARLRRMQAQQEFLRAVSSTSSR